MQLLFDDRLAPMTSSIGLLECDEERAIDTFVKWQSAIQATRGVTLSTRAVDGGLEAMLRMLPPLTNIEARRYLFATTRSGWVAFFDNFDRGSDAAPISYLTRTLHCRGIRAVAIPHQPPKERDGKWRGRYGALMLTVFAAEMIGHSNIRRSIEALNDGGRWRFETSGEPLPFENTSTYDAKRIADRFPFSALVEVLRGLGAAPFDADFYTGSGTLIEKHGPTAPRLRARSLEEVRDEL